MQRRKKRSLNREIKHFRDTNIIFIGIEGGSEKSREARYFDVFREENIRLQIKVIPCHEHKSAPLNVLNHLKETIKKEPIEEGDQIWLVIDYDRYGIHLPEVARLCKDSEINMALSNPCFELWLLLHFTDPAEELAECKSVKPILSEYMSESQGNSTGYSGIFKGLVHDAISRASARDNGKGRWPEKNGSHVYKLMNQFFG